MSSAGPEISIVGGGIVGLILGIGLIKRGVNIRIYEQSSSFREIGVGIAFTASAVRCMGLISEDVVEALRAGGANATSAEDADPEAKVHDFLRFVDGFNDTNSSIGAGANKHRSANGAILCQLDAGYKGFEGTRRDQFLEQLFLRLPSGVVQFKKRLESIDTLPVSGRTRLRFTDGSEVETDAVIGADGIKSKVREIMLGKDNPASYPTYSHCSAYRGLVKMSDAVQALGDWRARNQHMLVGPRAHIVHYPVANSTMVNVAAFAHDESNIDSIDNSVGMVPKADVMKAYEGWSQPIQNLLEFFPSEVSKWAMFDLWKYPLEQYNRGNLCLIGDAAHASLPHHGAGAGMGVEDVLCLCTLFEQTQMPFHGTEGDEDVNATLSLIFDIYSDLRKTRTQWLVDSSRRVCDLYQQPQWADPNQYNDAMACFNEIEDRSLKIWKFYPEAMVAESKAELQDRACCKDRT